MAAEGQQPWWKEVALYDGSQDWSPREIYISAFDGKNIQIRYRLTSDGSVTGDGFYLDNLVIVSQ